MKLFRSFLSLILLIAALLPTASASADGTIIVNTNADENLPNQSDGLCSLREAIHNANSDAATFADCAAGSGADTITFAGNYTITLQGSQLPIITGMLTINGNGVDNTIIQAHPEPNVAGHRVFHLGQSGNLTLDQVSVRNGRCNGGCIVYGDYGGAILSRGGTLTVSNSSFSGNSATYGGAISEDGATLTVTNTAFTNNSAGLEGGGIVVWNTGTIVVSNSRFSGNSAGNGGGIYIRRSFLTVANGVFTDNSAGGSGGAIDIFGDWTSTSVVESTFSNNSAGSWGGGIAAYKSLLSVGNSTFSENSAGDGGGISVNGSSLLLADLWVNNSTFSGNRAENEGGGIFIYATGSGVSNSTFSGNSAGTEGGGISVSFRASMSIANTIVANSLSGGNCAGAIDNGGNNLDSGTTCGWGSTFPSMSNTDPRLGLLADNGGPTQTHALLDGSPAINKGNAAVCGEADQRGVPRPQGIRCDIGAFEKENAPMSTFADVPAGYWAQDFIERLYWDGITGGCSLNPLQYCPEATVTRAQMAVFLLRGIHGFSYTPPPVGDDTGFADVPTGYWGAWIKQLAAERITGGCGGGKYCPEAPVTRAQMAVFLLRAKYGADYTPPAVGTTTGFSDVPPNHWAAAWIKQLVAEGITSGCGVGNYCSETPVNRAQMAVFLVKTFNLP